MSPKEYHNIFICFFFMPLLQIHPRHRASNEVGLIYTWRVSLLAGHVCLFCFVFLKGLALTFTLVIMHVPQELMYHFMMVLVKLYLLFPPLNTHFIILCFSPGLAVYLMLLKTWNCTVIQNLNALGPQSKRKWLHQTPQITSSNRFSFIICDNLSTFQGLLPPCCTY